MSLTLEYLSELSYAAHCVMHTMHLFT